jgi:hypothetical protein
MSFKKHILSILPLYLVFALITLGPALSQYITAQPVYPLHLVCAHAIFLLSYAATYPIILYLRKSTKYSSSS